MLLGALDPRRAIAIRLIGLALISWSVVKADRVPPGLHGRGIVVLIAFVVCLAAGLRWALTSIATLQDRGLTLDVWALAIAGGFLTTADPNSAASAFVFAGIVSAGARVELPAALPVVIAGALSLATAVLIYDASALGFVAYSLGFAAALLGANNARQSLARAEQAELLLAQTQRSHEEQLRSARLEESTRIAREIHDVLAHTLAGLTIQLEATGALIDQGADPASIKARVQRAEVLAREGLKETRRAVGALRGDGVATPGLEALVEEYREAAPAAVADLAIDGDAGRLTGETGTAVMRIVQEALTNVRKHAPGARVSVTVDAGAQPGDGLTAVIEDRGGDASGAPGGLADSGGGYGVRGMRERAEQLGGTLDAGPTDDGWRVVLRIPPRAAS